MHRIYDTTNHLHETYPEVIRYLTNLFMDAYREGNLLLAAKAGGVLTHLTGNTIQPAHTTDNLQITHMWPQADYGMRYMTHCFMELVLCELDSSVPYEPRLLGDSVESFVWRLTQEMDIGKRNSMKEIPVLMDAGLKNDEKRACESALRTAYDCAKLDADIFYTLSMIAEGKARKDESIQLTLLLPTAFDVDNMFNYEPMIDYIPGDVPTVPTRMDIGDGGVDGIGLLPMLAQSYTGLRDSYADYDISGCG